jgi:hypothetical protein
MSKLRGMGAELSAGVMFSPQQERSRLLVENTRIALDTIRKTSEAFGLETKIIKHPSRVYEIHFARGEEKLGRRSLTSDEIERYGGRTAGARIVEDICRYLDIKFSWDKVPEFSAPEPRGRVDVVHGPDEVKPQIIPEPRQEINVEDEKAWKSDWTVRQLKDWSAAQGKVVPATVKRKGDVLEWLANEYPDGG